LIAPTEQGGFMMWSIAIVPSTYTHHGYAIIQNTASKTIQARSLKNASEIGWKLTNIAMGDCITSLPDKEQLYFTDYNISPVYGNDWLSAIFRADHIYQKAIKYLYIVNTTTGHIQVNYTIPHIQGINPSLIVPGGHDDVFLGSRNGVIRLYKKKQQ
jgi:hypothetical protein